MARMVKSISELIPIRQYDALKDVFICQDGSVLNLFKISSKDMSTVTIEQIRRDNLYFLDFYRKYASDIKIVSINIPPSYSEQKKYYENKIQSTSNPVKRDILETRLYELNWIEKNRFEHEFFLMVFSENIHEYEKLHDLVKTLLMTRGLCEAINRVKKEQVLRKMANRNIRE